MLDKLIRYGEVERILGKNPQGLILDVGAGPEGLGACLPYRFVGVDTWYPEPPMQNQSAVKASAAALPFADASFDFVLCIEVFEHIPYDIRSQVMLELMRVARKKIVITHPVGIWGRLGDALLWAQYALLRPFKIQRPWWLTEHFQNPLPDPKKYLPGDMRNFRVTKLGQENWFVHNPLVFFGNLKAIQRRVKNYHNKHPERLKRLLGKINFPPYYRALVILDRL